MKQTCRGFSLLSGGLDSQLAIRVLERAGAHVEGIVFETPFFKADAAKKAAAALGSLAAASVKPRSRKHTLPA